MYSYVVCTCNATPVCCTAYGLYKFVCQDAGWYTYAFWHNRMQNLKIFLIFNILSQLQHLLSLRHYVLVDFGSIRLVWGQAEHILMECLALNATRILIIMSTEKSAGLDVFFPLPDVLLTSSSEFGIAGLVNFGPIRDAWALVLWYTHGGGLHKAPFAGLNFGWKILFWLYCCERKTLFWLKKQTERAKL